MATKTTRLKQFEFNKNITKMYSLLHKSKSHCLSSYQNYSTYAKLIYFNDFIKDGVSSGYAPFPMSINSIVELQKLIANSAPIDLRIYLNSVEVMNDADKAALLSDLVVIENKTFSRSIISPMTPANVKTLIDKEAIRTKMSVLWNSKLNTDLPITKFKQLKALLG